MGSQVELFDSGNEFYKNILDSLSDGVYFVDDQRRITYWNKGAHRITGYLSEDVLGRSCADNLLMHVTDDGTNLCQNGCPLQKTIQDGQPREAGLFLHHRNGHRVPVLVRVSPLTSPDGKIIGAVEVFSDNTTLMAALQQLGVLQKVASVDSLTKVGNRHYAELRLRNTFNEFLANRESFGIFFLDIDGFKAINDTFGHEVGDIVLQMVANTLRSNLRNTDFIGRWGGDEFIAIVSQVDEALSLALANKLRVLVEKSHITMDTSALVRVTVSIGATLARIDDTIESLLKRADQLLYQSKTGGRNRVSL